MKVSKDFVIQEFVPRSLWAEKKEHCIWFVSPTVIHLGQFYKDYFSDHYGQEVNVIVNDWLWGGTFHNRGWRYPNGEIGSALSFHRGGLCTAFDCEIRYASNNEEINPQEIHAHIIDNQKLFMNEGLTTLESKKFATGWTHSDHRNTGLDYILVVGD